jgi:hypothetical protein
MRVVQTTQIDKNRYGKLIEVNDKTGITFVYFSRTNATGRTKEGLLDCAFSPEGYQGFAYDLRRITGR